VFTPVSQYRHKLKVKRIAIGTIYVSPRLKHKIETIEHIIATIHSLRAQYDNEINFLIGGDFNQLDISEILDCYGGLSHVISVPTRNSATLEILLTDLHTMYHPPTTLPPLQVDTGKKGKDSDHNVVIFAPISNAQHMVERIKTTIKTRPRPESKISKFENDLACYPWDEVLANKTVNEQTEAFHHFLRITLDKYFSEKTVRISSLDKKG
jgi:hypothetical protein